MYTFSSGKTYFNHKISSKTYYQMKDIIKINTPVNIWFVRNNENGITRKG